MRPDSGSLYKMKATENLQYFTPGHFVVLDCPIIGVRKLAKVSESGYAYYDRIEAGQPNFPFPLFDNLNPICLGEISDWANEVGENYIDEAMTCWKALAEQPDPYLTKVRAYRWAIETGNFDPSEAIRNGRAATSKVSLAYEKMNAIVESVQPE